MSYKFAVQDTGRPYGPCEKIPDYAWRHRSRHTSLSAAEKAIRDYCAHCDYGSWDNHYRIIALHDLQMEFTFNCVECLATITVATTWPRGDAQPTVLPHDWPMPHICRTCYEAEQRKLSNIAV